MALLHLTFDNLEFSDLGHSDFSSFKVLPPLPPFLASTPRYEQREQYIEKDMH